jgi:hypothetical protein
VISVQDIRGFIDTPARRHSFYCYSTANFAQESAIFIILVNQFRHDRKKRQAVLINDWFILGQIPAALARGGFISQVNIDDDQAQRTRNAVTGSVAAIGRTFADKVQRHGFFGAIGAKLGDTRLPQGLFDVPWAQVMQLLCDSQRYEPNLFNANSVYQPRGEFAQQMQVLRRHLTEAGFSPDNLGLY